MRAALVKRGVAITPKRAKVLEILATSDEHPNVGDLHAEVQRWHPSTSLATVYNTIELLKETGQVLELEFSAAANRYDGRRPDSHPHLVCLECQRIDDLEVPEPEGIFEARDISVVPARAGNALGLLSSIEPAGAILRRIIEEAEAILTKRPSELLSR
ncbi:MAG TPA: transcriptional repressor [Dehalococcoidia bacterium]|nr:transcriptional repressor [Dehalococcoidia bacterium]